MEKTSTGLRANVAGLLCYVLGWISGLIFILIERDNKFVRFHAMQSLIAFGILSIAYFIIVTADWIPFEVRLWISWLILVITLTLWIQLMVKAGKGIPYKLPWLGNLIKKWIG